MTVKIKETSHYEDGQKKTKAARKAKKAALQPIDKTFDQLSSQEKDDLLKALAIAAGIIEE